MARPDPETFARIKRTEAYAEKVRKMFAQTVNDILALNKSLPTLDPGVMFSFDDEGNRKKAEQTEMLLRRLHAAATTAIEKGIKLEWDAANAETDKLIGSLFGKRVLNDENFRGWLHRNNDARRAFIERTDKGMNLSDRVWKSTRQLRDEMEIAMTIAIGEGDSAASMSRKVRQYLNDPDLMFRRFRYKDEEGNWQRKWKKRITDPDTGKHTWIDYDKDSYRDEWTGPGYYKSSAKNAMRVTRTETNMAYRAADNARWEQLDFILGIHIQPSESHPQPDICDELAGNYPKTFKFTGWHPQCFCVMTPILPKDDELEAMADAKLEGKEYTPETPAITDYPDNFKEFVRDNADNINKARLRGIEPYFLRDNKGIVDEILHSKTTDERAAERHAKRTEADVERIQTAWNTRLFNNFVAETDRIGSWRDKDMREWALILQYEIDLKEFGAFKIDYAKAKAALQGRISSETAAASSFMATKANAENMKVFAKTLGVEQGEYMTFFEADMLRSNPNFAADVMYRVNCQTCVVANELRRRGFNIQALGNFAGSKSEVLSRCTNGIWQTADGKVPSKMRIGAEFNQWSYIDPTGKRHKKGFAKTVANRKQLVSELETNLTEDGRYHIDWTWQGGGKTRSGHIITVEKIGDTIRYYDPQNGKVISDFKEYIKGIDLSRGINLLRVDNLRIKPDYAAEILTKSGTSASSGTAATGGVSRLRQDVLKQVRRNNTEWVKNNLPTVELPDGTPALRDVVKNIQGNNIIVNQGTFGEIFAKNINRNNISDILDVAHDYKEWMPRAELLTDGSPEPGRHHGYSFNVYRVTYRGQEIEIKTKLTDAEYLYNIKFI